MCGELKSILLLSFWEKMHLFEGDLIDFKNQTFVFFLQMKTEII